MARYIDADKVKEILCGNCTGKDKINCGYCKAGFDIDDVPTAADVQHIDKQKIKHCCDEIAETARPLSYAQWGYITEMLIEILDEVGYKENEDEDNQG